MIVSDTQICTLRTAQGVQLDQFVGRDQIGLSWSRVKNDTSQLELSLVGGAVDVNDISPWLHWIDVFDDKGVDRLWTGPITRATGSRLQVDISARDISALTTKTRCPLTKTWDATDPALIGTEFYEAVIDHHNLPAKTITRTDPLGDRFAYSSVADQVTVDSTINDLVAMGMYWTVVAGIPILGPWDRTPFVALGEEDFLGQGITVTRDGTASANDILLLTADSKSYGKVPMGGLSMQSIIKQDNMFGVSNTDKAVRQLARYSGKIHDVIAVPDGSVLHPTRTPIAIAQLIPSARITVTYRDKVYLMEITRVDVSSGSKGQGVAVSMVVADDNLPELLTIRSQGTTQ